MIRFHTVRRKQWVPRPIHEVFAFFSDASNLEELTPSWLGFRILTPGPIRIARDDLVAIHVATIARRGFRKNPSNSSPRLHRRPRLPIVRAKIAAPR